MEDGREEEDFDPLRLDILPSILRCHPGPLLSPPLGEGSVIRAARRSEDDRLYDIIEEIEGDEKILSVSCSGSSG